MVEEKMKNALRIQILALEVCDILGDKNTVKIFVLVNLTKSL